MFENYFSHGIKKTAYYFHENNKQLFTIDKLKKPRFSEDGSDLTICMLSLNRVKLTIKLLFSIEYYLTDFKGEILIIDNASSADQLAQIKEFAATSSLRIRIIELKENHGVGRARNLAAKEINTSWIMYIDNDMYFVKNPLKSIKETIEGLGCSFLNLPLINYDNKTPFALGGALFPYIWEQSAFIGGGSCYNFARSIEVDKINLGAPFLSDFLFGGASIVNKKAFLDVGGFDYDMFVGFEDIDLSLRLYNAGLKIGNIPEFTLIHNHKPSVNSDDLKAEKERFNNSIIKASADAFYKKNGIPVYDAGTEEWLKAREKELNLRGQTATKKTPTDKKAKVALIVDVKDWAFHNISKNVVKYLSDKYEFEILFSSDYSAENWLDLYPKLYNEQFDIILFFWRPQSKHLFSVELNYALEYKFNINPADFHEYLNNTVVLTGVYDHLYLKADEIMAQQEIYNNHVDGYFVASNLLKRLYEDIENYPNPYTVIQDGVDIDKFYPQGDRKILNRNTPLVVGWAGNSKWGHNEDGIDHKGFETIIKPAILELKAEGYAIELKYADKQEPETHIPMDKMADFYNEIDAYICTSDIEGTPNPVLESMACGIAILSTEVGIVPEVLGKKQQRYILKDRTKGELKAKLIQLIENRDLLAELGNENLVRIKHWTWEGKCERFDEMFEYYLHKKDIGKNHFKKFPYQFFSDQIGQIESHADFTEVNSDTLLTIPNSPDNVDLSAFIKERDEVSERYKKEKEVKEWYLRERNEMKEWYHKEYEVLPLWYKRVGHVIKAFQGKRTFKSLIKKQEA